MVSRTHPKKRICLAPVKRHQSTSSPEGERASKRMRNEKKMGQRSHRNPAKLTRADILVTQKYKEGAAVKQTFSLSYHQLLQQNLHKSAAAARQSRSEPQLGTVGTSTDKSPRKDSIGDSPAFFNKELLELSFEYKEDFAKSLLEVDSPDQQSSAKLCSRRTSRSCTNLSTESGAKLVASEIILSDTFKGWKASEISALPRYRHLLDQIPKDIDFIDSHCHLDFLFNKLSFTKSFEEFQLQHQDTFPSNYGGCVAIFCNPETFAEKSMWMPILECPKVWASFGCHPHHAYRYDSWSEASLEQALSHHRVVALGEIGLDYSYKNSVKPEIQHNVFRSQLKIAVRRGLPLVIHCRDAFQDTFAIIKELVPSDYRIHLHCFTGTWEEAGQWFQHFPQLCIGLTPLVTFTSATTVHQVARLVPLDKLLLETDAPFFVPAACKSSRLRYSHPGLAIHTAAQVAALKGISLEQVLRATRQNTARIYLI